MSGVKSPGQVTALGWRCLAGALGVALVGVVPLCAQLVKGFVFPEYYEPQELEQGQTNRFKGKITGQSARILQPGIYLLETPQIDRYARDGKTNLIARSPECVFDEKRQRISSTNRLVLEANSGQLFIEGEGYLCYVTNFHLMLSNRVWTLLSQELLQSSRNARPRASGSTSESPAGTNAPPFSTTNSPIQIFADALDFRHQVGVAIYSGHVRVEDAQMDLACELLTIRRATNGSIESIVAETNVVLVNKLDNSRGVGDRADYRLEEGQETLALTGTDAHWQDPQREGKARRFVFDLKNNTVQGEQNAWIKIPRTAMNETDFLKPAGTTNISRSVTNQFIEIASEFLFIQLPTTNHPARSITARTNVVVLSPADKSRATGEYAFYDEATGVTELIGDSVWQSDQRLVKGERLFYDRSNRVFRAERNAYLKMPASQPGRPTARTPTAVPTNAVLKAPVPAFIEVFADDYDFQSGYLTFHDHVRAKWLEGESPRAALTCDWLSLKLSNHVESASAKGCIFVEEFPVLSTNGTSIDRNLKCESLLLNFSTNGLVEQMVADKDVEAHQLEKPVAKPPIQSQLNSALLTVHFFAHTNQVREAIAERDVVIRQNQTTARGDKAVYTGTNGLVELTGNPTAEMPQGRITQAEILVWDRTQEKFFIKKFKAQGEGLPVGTNRSNLPSSK
jgi:lipopolysaccharide transport protein LptA